MSLFRKCISALFIAGFTVTGSAWSAAAETGDVPVARVHCPEDTVCFFTEPHFQGEESYWRSPRNPDCDAVPNAPARSIINNTDYPWAFYTRQYCSGEPDWLDRRTADPYIYSSYSWSG